MKYPIKKTKNYPYLFALLFTCLIATLLYTHGQSETLKWHAFSKAYVKDAFANDSLSLHFSFQNPKSLGIKNMPVSLPVYEKNTYQRIPEKIQNMQKLLNQIEPSQLTPRARKSFSIIQQYLNTQKQGANYLYFQQPLSPTSGIHISLPVLLAEYRMDTKQDVTDYLTLLSLLPSYFDSLVCYEEDQLEHGIGLSLSQTKKIQLQCQEFAHGGQELFTLCFENALSRLPLSPEEKQEYLFAHQEIYLTSVAPAYEALASKLSELPVHSTQSEGLCQYPEGVSYYRYLLKSNVGTDKNADQLLSLLNERLKSLFAQLSTYHESYSDSQLASLKKCEKELVNAFDLKRIDNYLPILEKSLGNSYPKLPASQLTKQEIRIKPIPTCLYDYTAPAYYFTPCISLCPAGRGQQVDNIIYYNVNATKDPSSLLTTLAHEGYPGHMYQNLYFLESDGVSFDNLLRFTLSFPGYSEGWAMYVELNSYDRLADSISAQNPSLQGQKCADYLRISRLSREIQLCMLCKLDILIHNHFATKEEIAPYLKAIGIHQEDSVSNIYEYLVSEPTNYLSYYVGYLELLECRKHFPDDSSFHTFILEHGPDSFFHIKKELTQKNPPQS